MFTLSPDQQEEAIRLAFAGDTTGKVLEKLGVSRKDFFAFKAADKAFSQKYAEALEEGIHAQVDDMFGIADDEEDLFRARLKIDVRKWAASKRLSRVYGDNVNVNVQNTVDINVAIMDARRRALPGDDARDVCAKVLPEVPETIGKIDALPTGLKPVAAPDARKSVHDAAPNTPKKAPALAPKASVASDATRRNPPSTERVKTQPNAKKLYDADDELELFGP